MINSAPKSTTPDEINYDTLRSVGKILQAAVDGLYKDFNAFSLLEGTDTTRAARDLYRQVAGKQVAYDILAPVLESVISAITVVDDNYKQRQG